MSRFHLFIFISLLFLTCKLQAQVMINKGSVVNATNGAVINVKGYLENESGEINVNFNQGLTAEIIVQNDFTNNAIAGGDGFYKIYGDWVNNSVFNSGTGSVFLLGNNQLLTGLESTYFFNLILNGTDAKTQTINQYVSGVLSLNHIELKTENFGLYVINDDANAITRTTGFVSSVSTGYLSRSTNSENYYLFPVGSSLNQTRYRPVEISPDDANPVTFTVRLANTDASLEGFNRDYSEDEICLLNPHFYHRVNRSSGNSSVSMKIYYDNTSDGSWSGIANWSANPDLWQIVQNSSVESNNPMWYAYVDNWDSFLQTPYILYNPNIIPQITEVGPFCENDEPLELAANPQGGIWSGNGIVDEEMGLFDPEVAGVGNHSISYQIDNGDCSAIGQTNISVVEVPEIQIKDVEPFCYKDTIITFSASPTGGLWSGSSISANGLLNVTQIQHGTHLFSYTLSGTCEAVETTELTIYPPIIDAELIATSPTCIGNNDGFIQVSVVGGTEPYFFYWNDESSSETGYLSGLTSGAYSVSIIDAYGCSLIRNQIVIPESDNDCVFIPNAFTPNGDGVNDEWIIDYIELFEESHVQVFNRWGQLLYEGFHGDPPWNGTYNNKPLPTGSYMYIVQLRRDKSSYVGIVTLIR